MQNATTSERTASLLVLYDWRDKLDQGAWIDLGLHFFDLIGAKANSAHWLRTTQRAGKRRSGKTKPENLIKSLARGPFIAASITTLLPPYDNEDRYSHVCGFKDPPDERRKSAYFCYETTTIDVELQTGLTQAFTSISKPGYGIGYLWPYRRGPVWHANDIGYSTMNDFANNNVPQWKEESKRQQIWRDERLDYSSPSPPAPFRHLCGMLRDVFEYNVLTNLHLQSEISGMTLLNWIIEHESRGRIDNIGNGLWAWFVPTERLKLVQDELQNAGLLITRTKKSNAA